MNSHDTRDRTSTSQSKMNQSSSLPVSTPKIPKKVAKKPSPKPNKDKTNALRDSTLKTRYCEGCATKLTNSQQYQEHIDHCTEYKKWQSRSVNNNNNTDVKTSDSCVVCGKQNNMKEMFPCDECGREYHIKCLDPPLKEVPDKEWICQRCAPKPNPYDEEYILDAVLNLQSTNKYCDGWEICTSKHNDLVLKMQVKTNPNWSMFWFASLENSPRFDLVNGNLKFIGYQQLDSKFVHNVYKISSQTMGEIERNSSPFNIASEEETLETILDIDLSSVEPPTNSSSDESNPIQGSITQTKRQIDQPENLAVKRLRKEKEILESDLQLVNALPISQNSDIFGYVESKQPSNYFWLSEIWKLPGDLNSKFLLLNDDPSLSTSNTANRMGFNKSNIHVSRSERYKISQIFN
jgi:hypothetical protein